MLECVPCTLEHIEQLKGRMREADRIELTLATGLPPEFVLEESYTISERSFTWLRGDVVLCVFGVNQSPTDPSMGIPWLIASDEAILVGKRLVRHCKQKIDELAQPYRLLYNMVHGDNVVALRWLQWCGFTFLDPIQVGPTGALFLPFIKETPLCVVP